MLKQWLGALAMLVLGVMPVQAAVKTWNGSASGFWSNSLNWTPAGAPGNGDTLIFPAVAGNRTNTHNLFTGLFTAVSIELQGCGYAIDSVSGSQLTLTAATPIINSCNTNLGVNSVNIDTLTLSAPVARLQNRTGLAGSAQFSTLQIATSANKNLMVSGDLIIDQANSVAGNFGLPRLQIDNLRGVATTDVTVSGGKVLFLATNSYGGVTLINQGLLEIGHSGALGAGGSLAGTRVVGPGGLGLSAGITMSGEFLELREDVIGQRPLFESVSGNNSWNGPITLAGSAAPNSAQLSAKANTLTIGGVIGGAGNLLIVGNGPLSNVDLLADNTYVGNTDISSNATLRLEVSSGENLPNAGNVNIAAGGQLGIKSLSGGSETIAALSGAGNILVTGPDTTLRINDPAGARSFSGIIGGDGRVQKIGPGSLVFSGNSTLTGNALVRGGILQITGDTSFTIDVDSLGVLATGANGRMQAARGQTASRNERNAVQGGLMSKIAPGGTGAFGVLSVSGVGGLQLGGLTPLELEISGNNPGIDQDQVHVQNSSSMLVLTGSQLILTVPVPLAPGSSAILLRNDSLSPISGEFFGITNASVVARSGVSYFLRYDGPTGSGNDVVLIRPPALNITTVGVPNGNAGAPYSQMLAASGGFPSYAFSLQSGSLPLGVTLDSAGRLAGTPGQVGTFNFTARVTDAAAGVADKAFTLVINAGSSTWSGGGSSVNWSNAANWLEGVSPATGNALVFPDVAAQKANFNDLPPGSSFAWISMEGVFYDITGSNIVLTDPVPLRWLRPPVSGGGALLKLEILATSVNPTIRARTSGNDMPGSMLVGQLAPSLPLRFSGLLTFDGLNTNNPIGTVPQLSVVLAGNLTSSSIEHNGRPGYVSVFGSYAGTTYVREGLLEVDSSVFASGDGTAATGAEVINNGVLAIRDFLGTPAINKRILLNDSGPGLKPKLSIIANIELGGPLVLTGQSIVDATGIARIVGPISGSGSMTAAGLTPSSLSIENAANNWSGGLTLADSITVIGGGLGESLPNALVPNLNVGTTLVLANGNETLAGLTGAGNVRLDATTLILNTPAMQTFTGAIQNGAMPGAVLKRGVGEQRLNGANTHSGPDVIQAGKYVLNGTHSAEVQIDLGILAGNGSIGSVRAHQTGVSSTGEIAPGFNILRTGNLNIGGALTYRVDANSNVPGTGHTQLDVSGSVTVSNTASLVVPPGPAIPVGNKLMIIKNDGTDPVSGTFAGAVQFSSGPNIFRINYAGGDGNDVELESVTGSVGTSTTIGADSPDPSLAGANYTVNVVVAALSGTLAPSGALALSAERSGSPISGESATCVAQAPSGATTPFVCTVSYAGANQPIGLRDLRASFTGNTPFQNSLDLASNAHRVQANTSTTIVSDNPDPSAIGQAVTVTWTVAAVSPAANPVTTGTVTVTASGGFNPERLSPPELCSAAVALGQCDITLSTGGARTLNAAFSGGGDYLDSTGTTSHTVSALPTISISDFSLVEGNSGVSNAVFTVSISALPSSGVTLNFATADGSAIAPVDYASTPGGLTFSNSGPLSFPVNVPVNGDTSVEPNEQFFVNLSNLAGPATLLDNQGVGTIQNDDAAVNTSSSIGLATPEPSLAGANYLVDVSVIAQSGTVAPAGTLTLIAERSGSVIIGETATCVAQTPSGVSTPFVCTVVSPGGNQPIGLRDLRANFAGNAPFQNSSAFAPNAHRVEANTTTAITSDSPDPSASGQVVTVAWSVNVAPPAAPPVPAGTVTVTASGGPETCSAPIAVGQCLITLNVPGPRTLSAAFAGGGDYRNSVGNTAHTVNPLPTISISDVTLNEGDSGTSNATFIVSISANPSGNVSIDFAAADGSATAPSDYTSTPGTLTFNSTGPLSLPINVSVNGDTAVEPNEQFFVNLSNLTGSATVLDNQGMGTIVNDDVLVNTSTTIGSDTPDPSLAGANFSVDVVVAALSGGAPPTGTLTLAVERTGSPIVGETATCVAQTPMGASRPYVCTVVSPSGNQPIGSRDLRASFTGSAPFQSSTAFAPNAHTVQANTSTVITSDSPDPSASGQVVTVAWTVSATPPAAPSVSAGIVTVTASGGPESCSAAVAAGQCLITLNATGPRTLTASYTGGGDYLNSNGTTAHTVNALPKISISDVVISEGNSGTSNAVFNVTISAAPLGNVTLDYASAPGTATSPSDFLATSGSLLFSSTGPLSLPVSVPINGDVLFEANEQFVLDLSNLMGPATLLDGQGVGTINNDDAVPTFTIGDVSVTEGNSGTSTLSFPVTLTGTPASPVTVDYASADASATQPVDYLPTSGSLNFAAPGTQLVSVTVNGDTNVEPDETLLLNLSNASAPATISDNQGIGSIVNDDVLVATSTTIGTDSPDPSVAGASYAVNVQVAALSGTLAPNGTLGLFTERAGTPIVGEVGSCVAQAPVALTTPFICTVSAPASNQPIGLRGLHAVFTANSPFQGSKGFVADAHTVQANTTTTITSDSPDPSLIGQAVTVAWNVSSNAPAAPPTLPSGIVTVTASGGPETCSAAIAAGQCSITLNVAGNRTLTASYTGGGDYLNSSGSTSHTVRAVVFTVSSPVASETAGQVIFVVTTDGPITLNYATGDGTAAAGSDYLAIAGSLSFAGAGSQNVLVQVTSENLVEGDETLRLIVSDSGTPATSVVGTATILNDDQAVLNVPARSLAEGNSGNTAFVYSFSLSNPVQGTVSVTATTTDVSATSPSDYAAISQVVSFSSGQLSRPFTVSVVGDTTFEPDETFKVNLTGLTLPTGINASAVTLGNATANGTIINDDAEPTTSLVSAITPPAPLLFPGNYSVNVLVSGSLSRPTGTAVVRATRSDSPGQVISCVPVLSSAVAANALQGGCVLVPTSPGVWETSVSFTASGLYADSVSTSTNYLVRGTVGALNPTVSLEQTVVGQSYTVNVPIVVSAGFPVPSGRVEVVQLPGGFMSQANVTAGVAIVTVTSRSAVVKTLLVRYVDPSGVYAERSTILNHQSNPAATSLLITGRSPLASLPGEAVSVSYQLAVSAPGSGIPTGSVRVTDGVSSNQCPLTATLIGNCSVVLNTIGSRPLTVTYLGDVDYLSSVSPPVQHPVGQGAQGVDLRVSIGNATRNIGAGSTVRYQIVVRNLGTVTVSGAQLQNALPLPASSQVWVCTAGAGSACGTGSGSGGIAQTLQVGAGSSVSLQVDVSFPANVEALVVNEVSVAPPIGISDLNPLDNVARDVDPIGLLGSGFEDDLGE